MHERNDETLHRASHGRAPFGTYHSPVGLERYIAELKTPLGRVSVCFEGQDGPRVAIRHGEPFFRALERAWNDSPGRADWDVHASFAGLSNPEIPGGFDFEQRVKVISAFLILAAEAIEVLASGQHSEVASLEEHARQLRLKSKATREVS